MSLKITFHIVICIVCFMAALTHEWCGRHDIAASFMIAFAILFIGFLL